MWLDSDFWALLYEMSKLNNLECMYITSKDKCYQLALGSCPNAVLWHQEVQEQESNHKEADTYLLLHSHHASASYNRIIVKCSNTHVFVLCIANQTNIGKPLFLITFLGNKLCIINISSISIYSLKKKLCKC